MKARVTSIAEPWGWYADLVGTARVLEVTQDPQIDHMYRVISGRHAGQSLLKKDCTIIAAKNQIADYLNQKT